MLGKQKDLASPRAAAVQAQPDLPKTTDGRTKGIRKGKREKGKRESNHEHLSQNPIAGLELASYSSYKGHKSTSAKGDSSTANRG